MDNETLLAITEIAKTITSVGILLAWVWAERQDNKELFSIIQALTDLRLRQLEKDEKNKDKLAIPTNWKNDNP